MIIFTGCKINLGLQILRRRSDGYHDISTVLYPVTGLCDALEIIPAQTPGCEFTSSGLAVDCDPRQNLCVRAYERMREQYHVPGVKIHLHKKIPFGAGLGGGSANAAGVITTLNELFGLGLVSCQLEQIAAELGSDIPFFITGQPALCEGRGERMTPINRTLEGYHWVIIKPSDRIGTAEAYAGVTPQESSVALSELVMLPVEQWRNELRNDFEPSIFARYPRIESLKQALYDCGARYASMSGSGSAVFGIFDHRVELSFPDCFVWQSE